MGCTCLPPWATDAYVERACDRHDLAYAAPTKSLRRRLLADAALAARVGAHGFKLALRGAWFIVLCPLLLAALVAFGGRWYYSKTESV